MPASLDDILTTQKNGVVAINLYSNTLLRGQGTTTSSTVTGATLIVSGRGYIVNYSVVVAGSAAGSIYNAASTSSTAAANKLCTTQTTANIYPVGQVFSNGLVVEPGTGQSINVTYSLG
jgi:hypothetical protein